MSTTVTIQNTPIAFPSSGDSPNWAQATTDFAVAVEDALNAVISSTDISPNSYLLDNTMNPISNQAISGLQFSTTTVRSAIVRYYVYRTTNSANAGEAGQLELNYNSNNASTSKWEVVRSCVGDGKIDFTVNDSGQVLFTTTTLSGTGHSGKIGFAASTLPQ